MKEDKVKFSKKLGLPPGSLVHLTKSKVNPTFCKLITYNNDFFEELKSDSFDFTSLLNNEDKVKWLSFIGLENTDLLLSFESGLTIHRLDLEDILNTEHRPKFNENGHYLFISLRKMEYDYHNKLKDEQISLIFGKGYVVSLLEENDDFYQPIHNRLSNKIGKLRGRSADYLLYVIIDLIADSFYKVFEVFDDKIEQLEEEVLNSPTPNTLKNIQILRKELMFIKKSVYPLRELVFSLEKSHSDLFHSSTQKYFRDIYDHTVSFVETAETHRDVLTTLMDIYLSSINNKTNQIMKVLTIITSVFIPLTFLAGVYGMNFENIPELRYKYGYHLFWVFTIVSGLLMLWWLRKKKWM